MEEIKRNIFFFFGGKGNGGRKRDNNMSIIYNIIFSQSLNMFKVQMTERKPPQHFKSQSFL